MFTFKYVALTQNNCRMKSCVNSHRKNGKMSCFTQSCRIIITIITYPCSRAIFDVYEQKTQLRLILPAIWCRDSHSSTRIIFQFEWNSEIFTSIPLLILPVRRQCAMCCSSLWIVINCISARISVEWFFDFFFLIFTSFLWRMVFISITSVDHQ